MRKKTKFILLTRHTDEELTHFLQREAENGWWLIKNNGNRFTFVEKKYEVESSDTSILSQDTNGKRKLTLMTCNSLKGSRIVVEAYAKE